jgi:hypothetical protein
MNKLRFVFLTIFALLVSGAVYATPNVPEIVVSSGVVNRVPVNVSNIYQLSIAHLYCYTKIVGAVNGDVIVHRWRVNGKIDRDIELQIGGSPWRTFSYKNLNGQKGSWTVEVMYKGEVLKTKAFVIK